MDFIKELTSKVSEIAQQKISPDTIVDAYCGLYTLDHDLPDRQSIVDCVQEARNQPKCDKTLITPLPILSLAHLSRPNRIQSYRTDDLQKISTVQVFTGLFYNKNLNSLTVEAHAYLYKAAQPSRDKIERGNNDNGQTPQEYFVPSLFVPVPCALPKRQATVVLPSQPPCIVYRWNHALKLVTHRGGIIEITSKCS